MSLKELTLSEIWIYPVKSLGGITLKTANVFPKGLQYDRRWMLVDENGMFMTQRALPQMALFKLSLMQDHFIITFKESSIDVPFNANINFTEQLKVWDDTILGSEVSKEHSLWFSQKLGVSCRLIHFPEENPRPVDPRYKVNDEHVSLADGYPFLIIGQQSLDDLNSRLEVAVPMNRLRPNFVFTGGEPHEEDLWRTFSIGSNKFIGVKPCSRCIIPTINQDTAEKGVEPLKTLSTYRKRDNKIYFGQNVVAVHSGKVSVGDKIFLN
jgi:MOSC domain-containing protein